MEIRNIRNLLETLHGRCATLVAAEQMDADLIVENDSIDWQEVVIACIQMLEDREAQIRALNSYISKQEVQAWAKNQTSSIGLKHGGS